MKIAHEIYILKFSNLYTLFGLIVNFNRFHKLFSPHVFTKSETNSEFSRLFSSTYFFDEKSQYEISKLHPFWPHCELFSKFCIWKKYLCIPERSSWMPSLYSIGHWGKMNTCLSNIEKKGRQRRKNPNRIELFNSIWKNLNWKRWVGKRCQTDCTEPYILENSTKGLLMLFGCSECLCMTTHECH